MRLVRYPIFYKICIYYPLYLQPNTLQILNSFVSSGQLNETVTCEFFFLGMTIRDKTVKPVILDMGNSSTSGKRIMTLMVGKLKYSVLLKITKLLEI